MLYLVITMRFNFYSSSRDRPWNCALDPTVAVTGIMSGAAYPYRTFPLQQGVSGFPEALMGRHR